MIGVIAYIIINLYLIYTDWTKRELDNIPLFLILLLGIVRLTMTYNSVYILSAFMFSLPLFILYLINDKLIGGGDIKYLFVSGLYLGLYIIILWYLMLFICVIWLVYLYLRHKLNKNMTVPLGSFIGISNIILSLLLVVRW